jgi:hypothetical protein
VPPHFSKKNLWLTMSLELFNHAIGLIRSANLQALEQYLQTYNFILTIVINEKERSYIEPLKWENYKWRNCYLKKLNKNDIRL